MPRNIEDLIVTGVQAGDTKDKSKGLYIIPYNKPSETQMAIEEDAVKGNLAPKGPEADIILVDSTDTIRTPLSIAQIKRDHYLITTKAGVHLVKRDETGSKQRQLFDFSRKIWKVLGSVGVKRHDKRSLEEDLRRFGKVVPEKMSLAQVNRMNSNEFLLSLFTESQVGETYREDKELNPMGTFYWRFKREIDDSFFDEKNKLGSLVEASYTGWTPTNFTRVQEIGGIEHTIMPNRNALDIIDHKIIDGKTMFNEIVKTYTFGEEGSKEAIISYDVMDNIAAAVLVDYDGEKFSIEIQQEDRKIRLASGTLNSVSEWPKSIKLMRHKEKIYCLVGCYRGAVYTIDCGKESLNPEGKITNINGFLPYKERRSKECSGSSDKHSIKEMLSGANSGHEIVLYCSNLLFKVKPDYFIKMNQPFYDGPVYSRLLEKATLPHRVMTVTFDRSHSK